MSMFKAPADRRIMTQVKLVRRDNDHTFETVVWLEAGGKLHRGMRVRLYGEEVWWDVDAAYSTMERGSINRDWKVGGIVKAYGR